MNEPLFKFIAASPTAFHAVAECSKALRAAGFTELSEGEAWDLTPGEGYFVTRNGSSIVAFRAVGGAKGYMITAAHCDSPSFRIRENSEAVDKHFVRLSVEGYGGMLYSTWLDRPLSVAGRVLVRTESGIKSLLLDFEEPICVIPNVAIHMNKNANKDMSFNPAIDLQPLYAEATDSRTTFRQRVAEKLGVSEGDILSTGLYLYNPAAGFEWGDFISAPRLDDLHCVYTSLRAFINAASFKSVPVFAVFDNEEVGSHTKQGAASTFLRDVLSRVGDKLGMDLRTALPSSLMLSCDNAHALHPNHPEYADKANAPVMNGGVVIKYTASQRYATDAVSAAMFTLICEKAGVKTQNYANRPDIPGGSTLGNISNSQVSLNTIDIGLAQLAMHSSYETAGARDTQAMIDCCRTFFESAIAVKGDGEYDIL